MSTTWKDKYTEDQLRIRRERAFLWNKANKDRVILNHRKYYALNRGRINQSLSDYQSNHKQENVSRLRKWREKYPWYNIWQMAKQRCTNPNNPRFKYYGGRGIKFLLSKADMQFMWIRDKAFDMLDPSLDRSDNTGHYSLDNCSFMTKSDNSRKRALDNWKLKLGYNVQDSEFRQAIGQAPSR